MSSKTLLHRNNVAAWVSPTVLQIYAQRSLYFDGHRRPHFYLATCFTMLGMRRGPLTLVPREPGWFFDTYFDP